MESDLKSRPSVRTIQLWWYPFAPKWRVPAVTRPTIAWRRGTLTIKYPGNSESLAVRLSSPTSWPVRPRCRRCPTPEWLSIEQTRVYGWIYGSAMWRRMIMLFMDTLSWSFVSLPTGHFFAALAGLMLELPFRINLMPRRIMYLSACLQVLDEYVLSGSSLLWEFGAMTFEDSTS